MSAYTTLKYTRTAAINFINQEIQHMSNEDIGNVLDKFLEKRLYNAWVLSDDTDVEVDVTHKH